MYKRILVPVDGSDTAKRGVQEAIRLASHQDAEIRLIHVVNEQVLLSYDGYGMDIASLLETLRKGGEKVLGETEKAVRAAGVSVQAILVDMNGGQEGEAIIQQAVDWPADIIVCGTHGRRGLRRLVLGSDAEYIVRHTPVPVLLVRHPDKGKT